MTIILIFVNTKDILYSSYGLGLQRHPNQTDSDVTFPDHAISGKSQKKSKDNYGRLINLLTQISVRPIFCQMCPMHIKKIK